MAITYQSLVASFLEHGVEAMFMLHMLAYNVDSAMDVVDFFFGGGANC